MDGDKHWWFCLKHNTVEDDDGVCPGKDRLGPYPTREAVPTAASVDSPWPYRPESV